MEGAQIYKIIFKLALGYHNDETLQKDTTSHKVLRIYVIFLNISFFLCCISQYVLCFYVVFHK